MRNLKFAALAATLLAFSAPAQAESGRGPIVIELFTSQSCFLCPPAEEFLGELIEAGDDILGLEFHVDYWDRLVYRNFGRWKDVYSDPAYTERQYAYGRQARERRGYVYTPQMVIDGVEEVRGSRRDEVQSILEDRRASGQAGVSVTVEANAAGGMRVSVDGSGEGQVWLVQFLRERTTVIPRGENHGKSLTNHNVVTGVRLIADFTGARETVDVPDALATHDVGCAVIVQRENQGAILGAGVCPTAGS